MERRTFKLFASWLIAVGTIWGIFLHTISSKDWGYYQNEARAEQETENNIRDEGEISKDKRTEENDAGPETKAAGTGTDNQDAKASATRSGTSDLNKRTSTRTIMQEDDAGVQTLETTLVSEPNGGKVSYEITDSELEELAACVEAEAGDQPYVGRQMVADVILNRVDDPDYPDTIHGVISQPYQFSVYWNGTMEKAVVSDKTYEAVREELAERSYPGLYFFRMGRYHTWGHPWRKIGDHYFSTK